MFGIPYKYATARDVQYGGDNGISVDGVKLLDGVKSLDSAKRRAGERASGRASHRAAKALQLYEPQFKCAIFSIYAISISSLDSVKSLDSAKHAAAQQMRAIEALTRGQARLEMLSLSSNPLYLVSTRLPQFKCAIFSIYTISGLRQI